MTIFQTSILMLLTHKGSINLEYFIDILNSKINFEFEIKGLNFSKTSLCFLEDKVEILFQDITKVIESEGECDTIEFEGSRGSFEYVITFTDDQKVELIKAKKQLIKLLCVINEFRIEKELLTA